MKNEKVTITDIADALGISSVSISRALSGQPGVSEVLKSKIFEKAQEMGYVKTKKNVPQTNILVLHQKPYSADNSNFSSMIQGIEKELQKADADYHVEFIDKSAQNKLALPYKLSKVSNFDGVILIGRFNLEYAAFINQKIRNLIFFTGYSPAYDYDSVWFSFNNAGYKQCEYLIKKGHKSIGFIGSNTFYRNKEKLLGITSALEDYQIQIHTEFFLDLDKDYHEKLGGLITAKKSPTAFICDHDFTAVELIKLLYENNIKVPNDISIVSSGNTEMSALSMPALTTLDLNLAYACKIVVRTLLNRISCPDKPSENIAILSSLVERDSVNNLWA